MITIKRFENRDAEVTFCFSTVCIIHSHTSLNTNQDLPRTHILSSTPAFANLTCSSSFGTNHPTSIIHHPSSIMSCCCNRCTRHTNHTRGAKDTKILPASSPLKAMEADWKSIMEQPKLYVPAEGFPTQCDTVLSPALTADRSPIYELSHQQRSEPTPPRCPSYSSYTAPSSTSPCDAGSTLLTENATEGCGKNICPVHCNPHSSTVNYDYIPKASSSIIPSTKETSVIDSMQTDTQRFATAFEFRKLSKQVMYSIYSKIFSLVNEKREDYNLALLQWNRSLAELAWRHARTMHKRGVVYTPEPSSNAISTNVSGAQVGDIGTRIFYEQLKVLGHEREMLNPYKTFCGIGVYGDNCRICVVQIFS